MFPSIEIAWPLIVAACAFMVLDIVTGFVGAAVNHCIDSKKMKSGLFHKTGFLLTIVFSVICEWTTQFIDLGFTIPVQTAVCTFIICIEIISNLENLGKISPELASSKLLSIFASDKIAQYENTINDADEIEQHIE